MYRQKGKFIFILVAVVLLASFASVLFHHHDDYKDHDHCSICHLAKQVTGLLLFASIIIGRLFSSARFEFPAAPAFQSFELVSRLKNRAPPVLAN